MKRRFANAVEGIYSQRRFDEKFFKGYICNIKLQNITNPLIVNNGKERVCIKDNNYEWFEVYPDKSNYAITIMFDDNKNLIEWYFDIAKQVGIENNVPFEDDLYLDMCVLPSGERIVLDEDELINALNKGEIQQSDVDLAYSTIKMLEEKFVENFDKLVDFTNKISELFASECKVVKKTNNVVNEKV